jgi:hypothetical protein
MKRISIVMFAIACGAPSSPPAAPLHVEASSSPPSADAAVTAPTPPDATPSLTLTAPSGLVIGSLPLVGDAPAGVGIVRVVKDWVALGWPDREGLAVQRVGAAAMWKSKAVALAMAKKQQYEVPIVDELADGLAISFRITDAGKSIYSLIAYRQIGADTYFCAGDSSFEARRDEMLAFCKSLRPR